MQVFFLSQTKNDLHLQPILMREELKGEPNCLQRALQDDLSYVADGKLLLR